MGKLRDWFRYSGVGPGSAKSGKFWLFPFYIWVCAFASYTCAHKYYRGNYFERNIIDTLLWSMGFSILSLLLYLWLQNKIKAIIRRNLAMETFQGRDKLEFQMLLHLCHIPLKDSSETKAHIHFIWTRSGTIIISLFAILFALPFFMGYPIGSYFSTFTAFPVMWLYTSITVGTFNRCIDAGIITLKYPSLFSYLSLNDSEHSTSTTREGSTENS